MKIKVTANLGNYENISVESNDYEWSEDCMNEVYTTLQAIREPRIDDLCKKVFKNYQKTGI